MDQEDATSGSASRQENRSETSPLEILIRDLGEIRRKKLPRERHRKWKEHPRATSLPLFDLRTRR